MLYGKDEALNQHRRHNWLFRVIAVWNDKPFDSFSFEGNLFVALRLLWTDLFSIIELLHWKATEDIVWGTYVCVICYTFVIGIYHRKATFIAYLRDTHLCSWQTYVPKTYSISVVIDVQCSTHIQRSEVIKIYLLVFCFLSTAKWPIYRRQNIVNLSTYSSSGIKQFAYKKH